MLITITPAFGLVVIRLTSERLTSERLPSEQPVNNDQLTITFNQSQGNHDFDPAGKYISTCSRARSVKFA
jgi:hypothetical protein